ncbi:MAG TPA: penicillin-binding transpeptidase domain-containing protein, partial [Acidimicrobiales bacterium]|nr:penicillin-binding transpeptidase domain-containing protein [Acidimicrobiales bacterium]
SVNTVYAQLVTQLGPKAAIEAVARYGIASPLEPFPSAVLGANSVTPLDMASAYSTLANRGTRVPPTFVTRVVGRDGRVIYEHAEAGRPVLSTEVADTVTAILEQAMHRGTGRRAVIGRPAAGKTGTAQEWRDAWFAGYTPDLTTVVWVGFPEGQVSMQPPATPIRVTGGSWPAQIWQRFMTRALAGVAPRPFVAPPPGALP